MKLIPFPESNITFAKDQPPYLPFPAYRDHTLPEVPVIGCWRLTWKERFAVLFSGVIWHSIWTFRNREGAPGALQPQLLQTTKPHMPKLPEPPPAQPVMPKEGPKLPNKPLEHMNLRECIDGANQYFADPVEFQSKRIKGKPVRVIVDKASQIVFGFGETNGHALVDGIAKMEERKKRALEAHAKKTGGQ